VFRGISARAKRRRRDFRSLNRLNRRLRRLKGMRRMRWEGATGLWIVATLLTSSCLLREAAAEEPAPSRLTPIYLAEPAAAAQTDWTDRLRKPADWLTLGADLRLREKYFNNMFSLDGSAPGHEWHFERFRLRGWATVSPADWIDVNGRLTWEGRHWWKPDTRDEWDESDVVIDTLNVKIKKLFGDTTTVTVGRQDIKLGDGWLVLDGTPLDGSRTIFFNAVRVNVDLKESKAGFDMIYIENFSDPDKFLPPFFSKDVPLIEQDERGVILWGTCKAVDKTEFNPYFIYKHNEAVLGNGDESDLFTIGLRAAREFSPHWKGRIEGAYQFGERDNAVLFPGANGDVSAFGLNSRLTYMFNDRMKNQLYATYEFLSGDDPDTGRVEQFDPLWGRWPQWSELYIYTYATETRIAEITNLHRLALNWQISPTDKMDITSGYAALFADENTRGALAGFDDSGKFRGHLITGVLRYRFNRHVAGHLWGELFFPGNYYDDGRDDMATFLRAELFLTF